LIDNPFAAYVDALPDLAEHERLRQKYRDMSRRAYALSRDNDRLRQVLAEAEDTRELLLVAGAVIGVQAAAIVGLVAWIVIG
jgi:hypothetical protein